MKINITKQNATVLASKDDLKPVLKGCLIDPENKKAVITNGHALIMYPLQMEEGEESARAVVPVDIFADTEKAKKTAEYCFNGRAVYQDQFGTKEREYIDAPYPDYRSVINDKPTAYTITLDLSLLAKIAKAIPGSANEQKAVRLHMTGTRSQVKFETTELYDGDKISGLIMPINDDKNGRPIYGKDQNGNIQEWKDDKK